MALDMIATLINQRHLVRCIHRLELIDEKLEKENIKICYKSLRRLSLILIIVIMFRKYLMILFGFFVFQLNFFQLWCMFVPICVSILSKVWFVLFVSNIRKKFEAINAHLNELGESIKAAKKKHFVNLSHSDETEKILDIDHNEAATDLITDYLRKEIVISKPKPKFMNILSRPPNALIKKFNSVYPNNTELLDTKSISNMFSRMRSPIRKSSSAIGDKFDKRLINLCFVHDEICEVSSIANYMFSFQMLMLMAYGFLGITAQLYFVYCSLAGQVSSGRNLFILK